MSSKTPDISDVAPVNLADEEQATPSDARSQRPFQPVPEIQALLDQLKSIGNDLDTLTRETVPSLRSVREEIAQRTLWHVPVEHIRSVAIPGEDCPVPVRLYVPYDKQLARDGKLPVVLFFHGGGWTLGSPNIYDSVTRQLARLIPAMVLSVDYRLAPENPFPCAVRDADAALAWVRSHVEEIDGDPTRVVLAGDSAGGTLATVAAMHSQARHEPPILMQALFYPSTNISCTNTNSFRQYGTDYLLTQQAVEAFRELYLPDPADRMRPEASPLLAEDLRGLPPTLIVGAGCDPLRDEGEAYARKLLVHGVQVSYRLESNLIHAFLNFYNLYPDCSPYAEAVLGYAAGVIRNRITAPLTRTR